MEFVAVQEQVEIDPPVAADAPAWLQPLAQRQRALGDLALHLRGLLSAPQPAHEEISRLVHRFVGGR
jgi:hypothetical protein